MTTDERAINGIVRELENTWNSYDSDGWAALFAEDANFIQIYGGQLEGRTAIEASHRCIFETIYKDSNATFKVRDIRFLRPDVAIVYTHALLKFYQGVQACEMDCRPTLTLVKQDGKWQIVSLQNTKISDMPLAAQAARRLAS